MFGETIRVRGLVQGVGFRPTVSRLANEYGLHGDVRNDGDGVLIRVWGNAATIDRFCQALRAECPPLARIHSLQRERLEAEPDTREFLILASAATHVQTGIVPDAATCRACCSEIFDPGNRRYRYPFTNCTHCGPRLSIIRGIPYDRGTTSMAVFQQCERCLEEYTDPGDRRFHAQPNACATCGPKVWLENSAGEKIERSTSDEDVIHQASRLLMAGKILAIKGVGGFHLACDACNETAVTELRRRKRRYQKPFALMARDLDIVRGYCQIGEGEDSLLGNTSAPIVLLTRNGREQVASGIAPGQQTLGFMLPYSPLHHLLMRDWDCPLVMTSGNLHEEPQCIDNADAEQRLQNLADYYLLHDRAIVNRVDDSVVRIMDGAPRFLRRARGYAPAPIVLPSGFEQVPPILALGGELKNTICLLKDGQAIVSQHLGNLEDARTTEEYQRTIDLYLRLFQHQPDILVVDQHPDYRSTRLGRAWKQREGLQLTTVQHHFAHIASVMADNAWPREGGQVLGIALDGLGYGPDGTIWGGEFLLADYCRFQRLGYFKPVPLLGGVKAMLEPWRNTYAQLATHLGWDKLISEYAELEITKFLSGKPTDILESMLQRGLNSPATSSCGRLFDAVAGILDISRESVAYEGQAAIELEALAVTAIDDCGDGYPFAAEHEDGRMILSAAPMWLALLDDLVQSRPRALIAARYHMGLARAVTDMGKQLAASAGTGTVALSGGVFQNRILFEAVTRSLRDAGLQVLSPRQLPANDGGLALGQAIIAAAQGIHESQTRTGSSPG